MPSQQWRNAFKLWLRKPSLRLWLQLQRQLTVRVKLTGDGAAAGDRTQLSQGPAIGPPCSPSITLRDVITAIDRSPLRQGPVVGRHCSPVNRARSRDGSHVIPLASLSYNQTSLNGWQESLPDDDGSFKSDHNPFSAMPGLEDCHLSGIRTALSKPEEVTTRGPYGARPVAGRKYAR